MSHLNAPAILDISTSSTVNAVSTPTVLVLPDVNQQRNCDYDPATGIITLQQNGNYRFDLQFLATSLLAGRLNFYPELDPGTGTFTAIPVSCRTVDVTGLSLNLVTFGVSGQFVQGARLRGRLFGTGYQLLSNTPTNSPVACPAARITMSN